MKNKNKLKSLISEKALIFSNENKIVVNATGVRRPWILQYWIISLSHEGSLATARCILEYLQRDFRSTQIAGVAMSGLPIVSSIVSCGKGRYSGLAVRINNENGFTSPIEGWGDTTRTVVVVDDTICTGKSMLKAIFLLEEQGYIVEGCICVVNFSGKGGAEAVAAYGYKLVTVFDLWKDIFPLSRHAVTNSIEAPKYEQAFFAPSENRETAELIIKVITKLLKDLALGIAVNEKNIAKEIISLPNIGIGVALYRNKLIGYWHSIMDNLPASILRATVGAWNDYTGNYPFETIDMSTTTIVVSFLQFCVPIEKINSIKIRLGFDTLSLNAGTSNVVVLAYLPCFENWDQNQVISKMLQMAGSKNGTHLWKKYGTDSWAFVNGRLRHLKYGFFEKETGQFDNLQLIKDLSKYIIRQFTHLIPKCSYNPVNDQWEGIDDAISVIGALQSLYHAGRLLDNSQYLEVAVSGLGYCCNFLENDNQGVRLNMADINCKNNPEAHLLSALCNEYIYPSIATDHLWVKQTREVALKVLSLVHPDGAISPLRNGQRAGTDQDILPGVTILALINYSRATGDKNYCDCIEKSFDWYKNRFRLVHPWELAWSHMQAWAAAYRMDNRKEYADFVFELADWAVLHQKSDGSFLISDSIDEPDFRTAYVLIGIANAWEIAVLENNILRIRNYFESWEKGVKFMTQLVVEYDDTFFMKNGVFAIGGVRQSLTKSFMHLEFTSTFLLALVNSISQKINYG